MWGASDDAETDRLCVEQLMRCDADIRELESRQSLPVWDGEVVVCGLVLRVALLGSRVVEVEVWRYQLPANCMSVLPSQPGKHH